MVSGELLGGGGPSASVLCPGSNRGGRGGAIALLGHPLGSNGACLTTKLLYEMESRKARLGLVTMCIGGGMGAASVFETEQ